VTEQLAELCKDLPGYLGGHLSLSASALAVGLAVSVPLGVLASRRPKLSELALGVAAVVQTVPSLALLALMVPLLGGMIGFAPAFLALVLYSVLPILANTVIGLRGVDPVLTEAARGLGMNDRQMLLRVQLPLAAPVLIAGVRTATVLVVGTATLATPVGEATLGNYIFQGLETRDHLSTVFGCVAAAVLAVVLDQLIRLLEAAARRRSRLLACVGAAGLLAVVGGGLYKPVARLLAGRTNRAVVASGPFTEQHVLSEVLARRLSAAGFAVDQRKGLGESIQFEALRRSQVDCLVDYTGNVWATLMKRSDFADRATTLAEVEGYLRREHGIVCLGPLGFEDAYALAVTRADAERHGLRTVDDLARHARRLREQGGRLRVGGDVQVFHRPEWRRVKDAYGLGDEDVETVDMDPTLMYSAVGRSVNAITAYTSDGRIKAYDLVLLEDSRHAFPPYDAVLLLSPQAAARPGLAEALRPLLGAIDVEAMREANRRVDLDRQRPARAAAELLERLGRGP
jgi:osmoprotectant transport system permease protein